MFVLDVSYLADLARIDALMEDHRAYLRRNYEAGIFLASGRKEPRTGGVIIATGDLAAIQELIKTDPFTRNGVATYAITEFLPTTTGPELAAFREQL
jgi:uncharacterized protein YciI